MGSYRILAGLSLSCLGFIPGCGTLIGLSDYGVAGSGGLGRAGAGDAGGADGCAVDCDDGNACTDDDCVSGQCVNQPVVLGTACGSLGSSCDADAVCVRCRDTAPDAGRDVGCPAAAPVCVGNGADASCGGCTMDIDCDDGNECTTEVCSGKQCVVTAVAAGRACATGVCSGVVGAEACVACVKDADCASDDVSCTAETCTNHACSHVPMDGLCPASGDVCKPNKCDTATNCMQIDISMKKPLMTSSSTLGNGSFEDGSNPATGWKEVSENYWIVNDCSSPGCQPSSFPNSAVLPSAGFDLAWLGGPTDKGVESLSHLLALPAGTTSLQILADTNFETKSTAATNKDYFEVRLLDADLMQIGAALLAKSAADAQSGAGAKVWSNDGINLSADVSARAGSDVYVSFWASCDTTQPTDFFMDNVRITATVCQ